MMLKIRKNIILILSCVMLFGCSNDGKDVKFFVNEFNSNKKTFRKLESYISDSVIIDNSPLRYRLTPRIKFINNGDKKYRNNQIYSYLDSLNIYSLVIEREHCDPQVAFDKYYLKIKNNDSENFNHTYYYLFDYCVSQNKNYKNENVVYIKLDSNWSLFIEK